MRIILGLLLTVFTFKVSASVNYLTNNLSDSEVANALFKCPNDLEALTKAFKPGNWYVDNVRSELETISPTQIKKTYIFTVNNFYGEYKVVGATRVPNFEKISLTITVNVDLSQGYTTNWVCGQISEPF